MWRMNADNDDDLDRLGFEPLASAARARVVIAKRLLPDYQQIADQQRARFEAIMRRWCEGVKLTPQMFNPNEGRSQSGILLQAFKAFKIRLYGFERRISSVRTFLIVDHDPAKKQDRADPNILKRSKRRLDDIGKGS